MIFEYVFVLLAPLFVFLWNSFPTAKFSTQLIAGCVIVYVLALVIKKVSRYLTVFLTTATILLAISQTGGVSSPLFFLAYFLAFITSYLLKPESVFFLLGALLLFFLPSTFTLIALLPHISLVLIFTLAFFVGKELKKEKELEAYTDKLQDLTQEIQEEQTNTN